MEPASSPQGMPLPKKLRPKQREIIEAFAKADEVIAKLPTGYGKTLAAAGSYAQLRHRAACNRMLYVVPRTNQATQAADSVPQELELFGVQTRAVDIGRDPMHALRSHHRGLIEVFVVTVQALLSSPATARTVSDLMQTGRWFVVIDEHHHYGDGTAWTEKVKALPSRAMLAMSATPNRHDESDHFPDPSVSETYRDAADAGYVKRLRLHAYEYVVDAITVDGRAIPFKTDEIVKEVGSDSPEAIDKHLAAKKMRWSPKYISPLITFPLDRIIDLRTRGVRSQMLVQAMSCTHASMVCEQIRMLLPSYMTVDWVGTGPSGRSDKENEDVVKRFCPEKDKSTGRRNWTLDVLVNVGIASEGLDTTDVTEVVFLRPANMTITDFQTMGRGARVMPGREVQPPCHVNVDTASAMAQYVGEKVMDLFDGDFSHKPDEKPPRGEDEYEPLPESMYVVVVDVHLSDIRKGKLFEIAYDGAVKEFPQATEEQLVAAAEKAMLNYMNSAGGNLSSILAQKRELIEGAVGKVVSLLVRRIASSGMRIEKSLPGDLKTRINSHKKTLFGGAVKSLPEEDLDRQWQWIRNLEQQIMLEHGLNGVPQWLR